MRKVRVAFVYDIRAQSAAFRLSNVQSAQPRYRQSTSTSSKQKHLRILMGELALLKARMLYGLRTMDHAKLDGMNGSDAKSLDDSTRVASERQTQKIRISIDASPVRNPGEHRQCGSRQLMETSIVSSLHHCGRLIRVRNQKHPGIVLNMLVGLLDTGVSEVPVPLVYVQ